MLKNPHCSMAMSAEQRSKFAALRLYWWRLHMSGKFSSGTKTPKQTNKQTNIHRLQYEACGKVHGQCPFNDDLYFLSRKKNLRLNIQFINIHCFTNCCIHVNLFEIYLLSLGCLVFPPHYFEFTILPNNRKYAFYSLSVHVMTYTSIPPGEM